MPTKNTGLWVAVVIAIGIAIFAAFRSSALLPGATTPGTRYPHGITVGNPTYSPTNLSLIQTGTCNAAMTTTLAATSSAAATCTVTGALAGDNVSVALPQAGSVASVWGGFIVSGTKATTDSITFNIFNGTGAATSSFALATTSVQYWVWRTQ